MIIIYAFPRSGSSLLHRNLVSELSYNSVFEPFGYLPDKLTDINNFIYINKWFKGAPNGNDLYKYKIKNYYIASIPENEFTCKEVAPYKSELKKYFQNIYKSYGNNTIVKLVRQQSNFIFIHKILVELGVEPKYIFLKRNPVEIAYSFYRGGCYYSFMNWYYKNLCEYRNVIYGNKSFFRNAKSPLDYLLASVLSDYGAFDESFRWLSKSNYRSLMLNYEDFIINPRKVLETIINNFIKNVDTSNLDINTGIKYNLSKLNFSSNDYFFNQQLISSNNRLSLKINIPHVKKIFSYRSARNLLFNNYYSHYLVRTYEAILRRIYWKTKWSALKPYINY
tara:strand:- start:1600 stop:2607 length:1008 start_codon:yes stop_codon:yes gene_type:complete